MPYPRLHRDDAEQDAPPTFRFSDFAGRAERDAARRPHDAERAIERVQKCLDRLDEQLLEPLPFRRFEDDDGPRAA
ncbi:MAG: hypothetical protein Kow0022_09080 [Phycisphaerales bacterium]